jgi:hypothetical protein
LALMSPQLPQIRPSEPVGWKSPHALRAVLM